jgi:cysteine desulfurase / selenocysteine lyase
MGGAKIWFLKKTELDLFQTMALKNKFLEMPFSINNMDVDDISYILAESFGINIRAGLHCAPLIHHYINSYPAGTVRISFSHLNTIDEANILVNAITQIAQTQTL